MRHDLISLGEPVNAELIAAQVVQSRAADISAHVANGRPEWTRLEWLEIRRIADDQLQPPAESEST
jgi:hypothetical protein